MYHTELHECFGADGVAATRTLAPATPEPSEPAATAIPTASPTPIPLPTVQPTPTPRASTTYAPGEEIQVTEDGRPWAVITVTQVSFHTSYAGGYFTDTPDPGNVYVQAWLTYEALTDGVDYNPFDWQVFNDGIAVDTGFEILYNEPTPDLGSGTLPHGRKAEGWVVYQVPASGELLMSYEGNMFLDEAPVFEVLLRNQ